MNGNKSPDIWRGEKIDKWSFVSFEDLKKIPLNVLASLASTRMPVVLSENNLVVAGHRGTLESIKKQEKSFVITIRVSCIDKPKRSARDEITFNAESKISLGLPIFA